MIRTTRSDLLWSYASQALKYGSTLLILPFVLVMLPKDQLAIWYIFTSITTFVMLLDFGFSSHITRNVTYVFSGSKKLLKEGIEVSEKEGISYQLLNSLIVVIKSIYRKLALAALIFLVTAGSFYYSTIIKNVNSTSNASLWVSWFIFITATVFNLYFIYLKCLLIGRGRIAHAQKAGLASVIMYITIGFAGLQSGFGLVALTAASLFSSLVNRYLSYRFFFDNDLSQRLSLNPASSNDFKKLLTAIWHNAKKIGLVMLGGFFTNHATLIILPAYIEIDVVAEYGLLQQFISVFVTVSVIFFSTFSPKMNNLFVVQRYDKLIKLLGLSLLVFLFCFTVCSLILILFGNNLLELIGSNTMLLPWRYMILMLIIAFLDQQHTMMAGVLSYNNKIPFVKPSLISGGLFIISALILLEFTELGLYAVILPRLVIQLAYNNWKWPVEASRMLNVHYLSIWKESFRNAGNLLFNKSY